MYSPRRTLKLSACMLILASGLIGFQSSHAESVAEKARSKKNDLLGYLRIIRPMVVNFPCDPFPACKADADKGKLVPDRLRRLENIKRIYQEGQIYFMEGSYLNAYLRFLDSQKRTEALLEGLSQSYIVRTERMMRTAVERKNKKNPEDVRSVDISIEFGRNSKLRRDFKLNRQSPDEQRRYNPRLVHYARNKYRIEKNMEKGYFHLGLAKKVRMRALNVDHNLPPHRKLTPRHRKMRIGYYIDTIVLSRMAKLNAEFIFNLKYPYDKYGIAHMPDKNLAALVKDNKFQMVSVPEIEKVRMAWLHNPYYMPKRLHPIFNLSVPETYRRDAADVRGMVYQDEVDSTVRFKVYKKPPATILSDGNKSTKTGTTSTKTQP